MSGDAAAPGEIVRIRADHRDPSTSRPRSRQRVLPSDPGQQTTERALALSVGPGSSRRGPEWAPPARPTGRPFGRDEDAVEDRLAGVSQSHAVLTASLEYLDTALHATQDHRVVADVGGQRLEGLSGPSSGSVS